MTKTISAAGYTLLMADEKGRLLDESPIIAWKPDNHGGPSTVGLGLQDVWAITLAYGGLRNVLMSEAYAATRLPDGRLYVAGMAQLTDQDTWLKWIAAGRPNRVQWPGSTTAAAKVAARRPPAKTEA